MRPMASLPWVGLVVFLAAPLAGAGFAAVRGLEAWRVANSFRERLDAELLGTTQRFDILEQRLAVMDSRTAKLEEAQLRLARSLAEAAVLNRALGEVREAVSGISGAVPR